MSQKEMFRAVKNGDIDKVRELLAADADLVHARDAEASTPIHYAAWKGHPEIIVLLADAGADVNAHNDNGHWGTTPLHAAAHGNRPQAVEALIRKGANVNSPKSTGPGTPLAETKVHNATAAAKVLRQAGATE
ncbi:MAG: ankyrin repeat domain-containing protein [Fimbriimonas sp.]|nr:ankyrin repeat domain-containing protein [Fimbriimonas sp.]